MGLLDGTMIGSNIGPSILNHASCSFASSGALLDGTWIGFNVRPSNALSDGSSDRTPFGTMPHAVSVGLLDGMLDLPMP